MTYTLARDREGKQIIIVEFSPGRLAPSIEAARYYGPLIREETRTDNKATDEYQRELKAKFPFAIRDIDIYLLAEIDGLQEAYMVKNSADFLQVSRDCEARLALSDYGPWLELTKSVPMRKVKMEYKDVHRHPGIKYPSSHPEQNIDDPAEDLFSATTQASELNGIRQRPAIDTDDLMDSAEVNNVYGFLHNASNLSQQSTLVGPGVEDDFDLEAFIRNEISSPTPVPTPRKQMLSSKPRPLTPEYFTPSPPRRSSGFVLKCKRCGAKRNTPWPENNRCERCGLKQHNNPPARSIMGYVPADA